MGTRREFRDRPDEEVAILDALVDRGEEGMTVLELRAVVDTDIDRIESALERLKNDGLIAVEENDGRICIKPDDRVIPDSEDPSNEPTGIFDGIRERFGF